jgi:Type II CAAX prenyl endopeptidase Rce1-like
MSAISLATRRPFNWKVFLFLLVLIVLASYAIIPYSLTLTSSTLTLPAILINGLIGALQTGVFAAIGLFLAARIGLGLPFVEAWVKREPMQSRYGRALLLAVLVGVVAGLLIIVLDTFVFGPPLAAELDRLGIGLPATLEPPAWQGLLASFSAGVNEEVMFRLFGVTLLAWLGGLISRDSEGRPKPAVCWIVIIMIAVAFGLAHLPTMSAIGIPIDALVVTRSIVLNGIGGIAFGWLYWKRGLESAMVGHFSADIVLHVLLVLALRGS